MEKEFSLLCNLFFNKATQPLKVHVILFTRKIKKTYFSLDFIPWVTESQNHSVAEAGQHL